MKKIVLIIMVFSLILINCGTDATEPIDIEPIEYKNSLPSNVWFEDVRPDSIFVSTEAFPISYNSSETTYAFIKVLDTGRVIVAKYIKKDLDGKPLSATRDETIAYAKKITSTLEDFEIDIPEVTGTDGKPLAPAYKIARKLNLANSKHRIINKPYVYNGEKVYDYFCTFQSLSQYDEGESYINIIANITSGKIRVFKFASILLGGVEHFYYKEGQSANAEDKLLADRFSEMAIQPSYSKAVEFIFIPK